MLTAVRLGCALLLVAFAVAVPSAASAQTRELAISVDPTLATSEHVDAIVEGGGARDVGRIATRSGVRGVVLGEIIVTAGSGADLTAFLERSGGEVVDSFQAEPGKPQTHLVRISPPPPGPPTDIARRLAATEPNDGALRVDGSRTLALLDVLSRESTRDGIEVSLNWIDEADGVVEGSMLEHSAWPNVFEWSLVSSTRKQAIGLDYAWQLLEWKHKLKPQFRALISDGGFAQHHDLPPYTLRDDKWLAKSRYGDTPFHGTMVALTLAATQDNRFGVAGTASRVIGELVAVARFKDTWKSLRRLEEHVDTYRPAVVNMSFSTRPTVGKAAYRSLMDTRYKRMVTGGALLVASAGNDGDDVDRHENVTVAGIPQEEPLVYPCESRYVMCVGGLAWNSTSRDPASNYGTAGPDDDESVEIYGPYEVPGVEHPQVVTNTTKTWWTGTSFAAPWVAGVALLVKAANPGLGPGDLRRILLDTAHRGVGNLPVNLTNSKPWVDAGAAVTAALGVTAPAPTVTITKPADNAQSPPGNGLLVAATAKNFAGATLPIRWRSDRDGALFGNDPRESGWAVLSPGTHKLTATAADVRGKTSSDSVTVHIKPDAPITMINTPGDGAAIPAGSSLSLDGSTRLTSGTYESLPAASVRWRIYRWGTATLAWTGIGHQRSVPAGVLAPGAYRITFRADPGSGGAVGHDEVTLLVNTVPAGQTPPTPVLKWPVYGADYVLAPGASSVAVDLWGLAGDAQDGPLDGTALQWVARSGDQRIVLCTGSRFPKQATEGGPGEPAIAIVSDCSHRTVNLRPPAAAPHSNVWVLELRAVDRDGIVSAPATRRIRVSHPMPG